MDSRAIRVSVSPERAFAPIWRIGGRTGWYYGNWLWRIRGWMDRLVGGVGLRRGRRDPEHIHAGDHIDCWRVDAVQEGERAWLLRLYAEMKTPGRAWLQFEVQEVRGGDDAGGSIIRQTAIFDPMGLTGLLYWYALYPVHQFVFQGMLEGIARAAEGEGSRAEESRQPNAVREGVS